MGSPRTFVRASDWRTVMALEISGPGGSALARIQRPEKSGLSWTASACPRAAEGIRNTSRRAIRQLVTGPLDPDGSVSVPHHYEALIRYAASSALRDACPNTRSASGIVVTAPTRTRVRPT